MNTTLIALAAAVLIAAGSALPAYWVGDTHGAARAQQAWDNDTANQATAAAQETNTTRTKEQGHANSVTQAVDEFHAAQAPAAADSAARVADAVRWQRAAEGRAAQYLAMSMAGEAERNRLASHAARLDSSLAEGRRVAEQLRADLVDRDLRISLLANVIHADRDLFEDGGTTQAAGH